VAAFDDAWRDVEPQLRRSLAARGVPRQERDDLVQETALRLYRSWRTVDAARPLLPFTVTIAMNAWRDLCRSEHRRVPVASDVDWVDVCAVDDVESQVLARDQLGRLAAALRSVPPAQRSLLLDHDELVASVRPLAPAERVARMRARRQLARLVGRASAALAALWVHRLARTSELTAATACAGVVAMSAAGVALAPAPVMAALPSRQPIPIHAVRLPAAPSAAHHASVHRIVRSPASSVHKPVRAHRSSRMVCSPAQVDDGSAASNNGAGVGSGGLYQEDAQGHQQPVVVTPAVEAKPDTQCVQVGG
jgi:RNA polymerase sigma factor (sigma-70 family)